MSAKPILDRAIEVARAELPPRLDPNRAHRMVELALQQRATNSQQAPDHAWRWTRWLAWLAVPTAAAIALWLVTRPAAGPLPLAPSELVLPTGDRIASVAGTQLDVTETTALQRAIRITHGTALFDVRPLAANERFVVHTPDTDIVVTGTVFSVDVAAGETTVRVYEGHVRVRQGGTDHPLPAGSQLGPDGGVTAISGDPLGELGAERARMRIAARGDEQVVRDGSRTRANPPDPTRDATVPPSPTLGQAPTATRPTPVVPVRPTQNATTRTDPTPAHDDPVPQIERAQVVALLAAGKHAAARDLARVNQWHVLEGDAHRGLGAHALAVAAYERALRSADLDDACIAGLHAARLYADQLALPSRAFEVLEHAAIPRCPTRERALAYTLQLATRLSRPDIGREAARRYLAAFPRGDSASSARSFVSADEAARP